MAKKQRLLTELQQKFVNAYLGEANYNATLACRLAGYTGSDNSLAVQGYDNLRLPKIAEIIELRLTESAMTADENLKHIGELARGNIPAAFFLKRKTVTQKDDNGNEIETTRVDVDWDRAEQYGHLIREISFTANGPKIILHDRLKALELIGKHYGHFEPGSIEPQSVIQYTPEQWKAEQEDRRRAAQDTLDLFEADDVED